MSHKYSIHETCKLAILKSELPKHKCVKAKPLGAVKCPLC